MQQDPPLIIAIESARASLPTRHREVLETGVIASIMVVVSATMIGSIVVGTARETAYISPPHHDDSPRASACLRTPATGRLIANQYTAAVTASTLFPYPYYRYQHVALAAHVHNS